MLGHRLYLHNPQLICSTKQFNPNAELAAHNVDVNTNLSIYVRLVQSLQGQEPILQAVVYGRDNQESFLCHQCVRFIADRLCKSPVIP